MASKLIHLAKRLYYTKLLDNLWTRSHNIRSLLPLFVLLFDLELLRSIQGVSFAYVRSHCPVAHLESWHQLRVLFFKETSFLLLSFSRGLMHSSLVQFLRPK